jgi:RHS repeat-associated protein
LKRIIAGDRNTSAVSEQTYDANTGLLLSEIDHDGTSTGFRYDAAQRLVLAWGQGWETRYSLTETPDGTETLETTSGTDTQEVVSHIRRFFLGLGLMYRQEVRTQDSGQTTPVITYTQYDALGRAVEFANPFRPDELPCLNKVTYDEQGRVQRLATGGNKGNAWTYSYDDTPAVQADIQPPQYTWYRTRHVTDIYGNSRVFIHGIDDRVDLMIEANPTTLGTVYESDAIATHYQYDGVNRLTAVWVLGGEALIFQYAAFQYDNLGRITGRRLCSRDSRLTAPAASRATAAWGSVDRSTKWSDLYRWHGYSKLAAHVDPRGIETVNDYEPAGLKRLVGTRRNDIPRGGGAHSIAATPDVQFTYTRDASPFRVETVAVEGHAVERFDYVFPDVRVTFSPRPQNNPSSLAFISQCDADGLGRIASTQFSLQNQPSSIRKQSYGYGLNNIVENNQVSSVGGIINQTYNAEGFPLLGLMLDRQGVLMGSESRDYESSVEGRNMQAHVVSDAAGTKLLEYGYQTRGGVDGDAQIARLREPRGVLDRDYVYDRDGRLSSVRDARTANPAWSVDYDYDSYGSRIWTGARGVWPDGRPVTPDGRSTTVLPGTYRLAEGGVAYDEAGNVTRASLNGHWLTFKYDFANRLVSTSDDQGQILEEYGYEQDARRVSVRTSSTLVTELWAGESLAARIEGLPGSTSSTVTELRFKMQGTDTHLQERMDLQAGTDVVYLVTDRPAGRALALPTSGLPKSWAYLPFGTHIVDTGSGASEQAYGFDSYVRSSITGLDYAGTRYYASEIGRFLSPDPHLLTLQPTAARMDPYSYCENDPINHIDPSGRQSKEWMTNVSFNPEIELWADEILVIGYPPAETSYGPPPSWGFVPGGGSFGGAGASGSWEQPDRSRRRAERQGLVSLLRGNRKSSPFEIGKLKELEILQGLEGQQIEFDSIVKPGTLRFLDHISKKIGLVEVKYVARQSLTHQIADHILIAGALELTYYLVTKNNTQLSAPLERAVGQGYVNWIPVLR